MSIYNFKLYLKENKVLVSEGPIPLVKFSLNSFKEYNKQVNSFKEYNNPDSIWNEWKECRKWLVENYLGHGG